MEPNSCACPDLHSDLELALLEVLEQNPAQPCAAVSACESQRAEQRSGREREQIRTKQAPFLPPLPLHMQQRTQGLWSPDALTESPKTLEHNRSPMQQRTPGLWLQDAIALLTMKLLSLP